MKIPKMFRKKHDEMVRKYGKLYTEGLKTDGLVVKMQDGTEFTLGGSGEVVEVKQGRKAKKGRKK